MVIGGHHNPVMKSDEWITPPFITNDLGPFDLDPCSPISRPWDIAREHLTILDDGLSRNWFGFVWCNPPYNLKAKMWLDKLSKHKNGIALIFARTETKMFVEFVWEKADALLFIYGRLHFHKPDGTRMKTNSGAPSVLVAYGKEAMNKLKVSRIKGKYIELKGRSQ